MYYTAAYIRLSREDGDKEESDSVANQRKLLQDYIGRTEGLVYAASMWMTVSAELIFAGRPSRICCGTSGTGQSPVWR